MCHHIRLQKTSIMPLFQWVIFFCRVQRGILHLTRYNKDEQLRTHVIPKGTIQISAYFLHCNKEKNKKGENLYYSYGYDSVNNRLMQMKAGEDGDSLYKNEFDLICKHTYVDRTNGIVDIK